MRKLLIPNNTSTLDRVARVVLGSALLSLVFLGPETPWGFVGLVLIATGIAGSCPIYRALGISTCPTTPTGQTTS